MELLRVATAGSVDDGKSTLIGRLLYDCHYIYEDQLEAVKRASKNAEGDFDLSLITDGLRAEREQGITIDVAYRYFSTPKRRFIVADVPGHVQYTRNMVTGASNSDLAIVLADAGKGLLEQSRRHLFVASLLGIPHVLILVNKMDMVDYDEGVFEEVKKQFMEFAAKLEIKDLQFIPISALKGDMVVERGEKMSWYQGRTVLDYLENVQVAADKDLINLRLPVQMVLKGNARGYAGLMESGSLKLGDEVMVIPSLKRSNVSTIYSGGEVIEKVSAGESVLVELEDELDVSRGDMIVRAGNVPEISNEFEATICWMNEEAMEIGKSYIIKQTTKSVRGYVDVLHHKVNVDDLHRENADDLKLNEIGRVRIRSKEPLFFDAYAKNSSTGSFIIIDEFSNNTVGAGVILRKVQTEAALGFRGDLKVKQGAVLWFTGLSGAGKTTIASRLGEVLGSSGLAFEHLDGDVMRGCLSKDLGFSVEDRSRNLERAAYVAGMLAKHGVIVLASFISPMKEQREMVKELVDGESFEDGKNTRALPFVEIFVNTPLEVCEKRDVKGLYSRARAGEIEDFTGVSAEYEAPVSPDIEINGDEESVEEAVEKILEYLLERGLIVKACK